MATTNTVSADTLAKPTFKNQYENYIGGEWTAPARGQYFEN
ncbi:MAG: aldehyde dehydrogenase B, partial [Bacteroidota bacterium]